MAQDRRDRDRHGPGRVGEEARVGLDLDREPLVDLQVEQELVRIRTPARTVGTEAGGRRDRPPRRSRPRMRMPRPARLPGTRRRADRAARARPVQLPRTGCSARIFVRPVLAFVGLPGPPWHFEPGSPRHEPFVHRPVFHERHASVSSSIDDNNASRVPGLRAPALTPRRLLPRSGRMRQATILSEPLAGLQAQALGLAEAAGLEAEVVLASAARAVALGRGPAVAGAARGPSTRDPANDILLSAGGTAGVVADALRRPGRRLVQIQHPRFDPSRFDVIVVNRHDGLTGPNVVVTRTALHRATPERMAEGAASWAARLAHLPRPLVAVLVGGSNGRFRLDEAVARRVGAAAGRDDTADRVGLAVTPSRRTSPEARAALAEAVAPLGGGSGTCRARTRISACSGWPTRSWSPRTACRWCPRRSRPARRCCWPGFPDGPAGSGYSTGCWWRTAASGR